MEKNTKNISIPVFSYGISILLIYPFLKWLIQYFKLPFYYLFFLSILSGFLVKNILSSINEKYSFTEKILKNIYFLYYLLFFLKIENFIREKKNAFFFGMFASILLILLYIGLYNKISFKFTGLYSLYYSILIYIKLRNSVVNHTVFQLPENQILKWYDFLQFYSIQEKTQSVEKNTKKTLYFLDIQKNHEFKNITSVYSTHPNGNFLNFFLTFFHIVKKIKFYAIKFFFGFVVTLSSYISYSHFVSTIDGLNGIRPRVVRKIESLKDLTQHSIHCTESKLHLSNESNFVVVENALKKFRLDVLEKLNTNFFFLEKLSEKITNLPLTYFFF